MARSWAAATAAGRACGEKLRRGGRLSRSTRLGWLSAPSTARLSLRRPRRLLLSIQWARARYSGPAHVTVGPRTFDWRGLAAGSVDRAGVVAATLVTLVRLA